MCVCVSKLCVSKLCVSKLCVSKLRVSKLYVSKLLRRREADGTRADGRIQNQKQEPHTKIGEISSHRLQLAPPSFRILKRVQVDRGNKALHHWCK